MKKQLLTSVLTELVNTYIMSNEYGASLITIPDFNYAQLAGDLNTNRNIHIFFLGFSEARQQELIRTLPDRGEKIAYAFTAEEAERSRNSGDESTFRLLVIKRTEMAKISSLRWFPEITLEKTYIKSCDYVKNKLASINNVIGALIQALRCKQIRSILSFERVLGYLELLLNAKAMDLPSAIKENYYRLGLCSDKNIDINNPTREDFIKRIWRNHALVERIGNLEQAERQGITNYYSKDYVNKRLPRLILSYYESRDIELLKEIELDELEKCLKAVKKSTASQSGTSQGRVARTKPTALAAQLIFDDNQTQINKILEKIGQELDGRGRRAKSEKLNIDYDDIKLQVHTNPITEAIAAELTEEDELGGIIHAETQTPSEAIRDRGKYLTDIFKRSDIDKLYESLAKISGLLSEDESISKNLRLFIQARDKAVPYKKRLQDSPMLQVVAQYKIFSDYLLAYEKLLNAINEDFHKLWRISPTRVKEIINTIMSLDYVFVVGEEKLHAVPTPLHPLYLWKYVELAKEILSNKGLNDTEECHLTEEDRSFIIRKADDIPDPLSVMLMPPTINGGGAAFLPLAGRIGMLPIYSNQPQINQSENGIDILKQQIIRYLCLYPHAGMMLRLAVIDPPSVEAVVAMLKALSNDKEFNISGIEVSIFRTKEVPNSWVELEEEALSNGLLGRYKGKDSLSFKLKIIDRRCTYAQIIDLLALQQHLLIMFDPNEVKIEAMSNSRHIHLHPLCVPKIYSFDAVEEQVKIRPANEGSIFSTYSSIVEKLNEQPSAFRHTSTYFNTPLKRETYDGLLKKSDWLIILDQSLKSWDISLRAASEKLFYKEDGYRSIGIYSINCRKFIIGYDSLVKHLGNFIPNEEGIKKIIDAIREINNDGLLSIVSHTSTRIFDTNHGKGSLGLAIAAIRYRRQHPDALLVGLDTQLAQEWLSDREDGRLPDLIGIRLEEGSADIDIIEVKTYEANRNSFIIKNSRISGHAIQQAIVLEELAREMFGATEKITTVSRREILREQVFEGLFQAELEPKEKLSYSNQLNELFAGQYKLNIEKHIYFVDFERSESKTVQYDGAQELAQEHFKLVTIGSNEIQAILTGANCAVPASDLLNVTSHPCAVKQTAAPDLAVVAVSEEAVAEIALTAVPTASEMKAVDNLVGGAAFGARVERQLEEKCAKINKVFRDYGINAYPVAVEQVQEAARFTRFAVELKSGETIRSLERYKNDIGRQLEANGEILIDHIKGTRYISVDVPFTGLNKVIKLTEQLSILKASGGRLDIIAGQLPNGKIEVVDIADAPHMLIAGTTGSGKTIFLHTMLVSLLQQYSSDELELLIVDPKQTDFIFFEGIPHLYGGKVILDAEEALRCINELNTIVKEKRTAELRACRSKDIESYNGKNPGNKMKRLVVIIDEYSDLVQAAEMAGTRKELERTLLMLLQRVRNLGIHFIIATQRPSAQIITGALKALIPVRVSFRLPSHVDSQTILDMSGAENLLGKGDMLMVTEGDTRRMQGLYISESELAEFVGGL